MQLLKRSAVHAIQAPFGKFIIIGSTGFVLDATLTVLFLHAAGLEMLSARACSFVLVSLFCWQGNRRWTFQVTGRARAREYGRYLAVNLLGVAVNLLIYSWMLRDHSDSIPYTVLAVAAGTLASLGISFTGMRRWVFRPVATPQKP
jgi:putative flippase GtrA